MAVATHHLSTLSTAYTNSTGQVAAQICRRRKAVNASCSGVRQIVELLQLGRCSSVHDGARAYGLASSNYLQKRRNLYNYGALRIRRLHEGFKEPIFPNKGFPDRRKFACKLSKDSLVPNLELEPTGKEFGRRPANQFNGIFLLLILNIGIYVADHILHLPGTRSLYLNHVRPQWWQFITSTFCHFNWNHLSSNLFFLYIFGKLVEEEGGIVGVWSSYLITGIGANIVSYLLLPHSSGGAAVASCGASGAVFGLFAISVLVKLSWNWRKILEVLILGQFVVEKVIAEAAMSARGTKGLLSGGINHVAHLAGALVGVAFIYLISRVPDGASGGKNQDRL